MRGISDKYVSRVFPLVKSSKAIDVIGYFCNLMGAGVDLSEVRDWQDLVPKILSRTEGKEISSKLSFLTGGLWATVVPAWFSAASMIDPQDGSFDYIWSDVVVTLDPKTIDEVNGIGAFASQTASLTSDQKRFIADFVRVALSSSAFQQHKDDWRQGPYIERVLKTWPIID